MNDDDDVTVIVQCVLRGTNMVKEGIQVVKVRYNGGGGEHAGKTECYYVKPTKAQLNNKPEFRDAIPENARGLREVMPEISEIFSKASRIVVLGDPSPINYYFALCELPNMFTYELKVVAKPPQSLIDKSFI